MAPVTGSVSLDGEPFPGGNRIIFTPLEEGKLAVGVIQDDGTFQLKTGSLSNGALVGKYRVTVRGVSDAEDEKFQATYVSSNENPFEVLPGQENNLEVKISLEDGWHGAQGW